jgi:hypothetical protein
MVFNATFNDISAISWRRVLLMEESSRDPFDYPEIDPHYLENPHDVKVLISGKYQ